MSFKIVLLCAQAVLIQAISGACIGGAYNGYGEGYGWPSAYEGFNTPCGEWATGGRMRAAELSYENAALADGRYGYSLGGFGAGSMAASNGGGLAVASSSPISPNGVSLLSENAIEGALAVAGEIPFLGTVGLEGALPTAGAGGVAYSSGNGNVGILSEDFSGAAYPGYAGAYGAGALAGPYAGSYGAGSFGAGSYGAGLYGAGLAGSALSGSAYGLNRGCGCGRV